MLTLRDENDRLTRELQRLQEREQQVAAALIRAEEQARQLLEQTDRRCREMVEQRRQTLQELDRLIQLRVARLQDITEQVALTAGEFRRASLQQQKSLEDMLREEGQQSA